MLSRLQSLIPAICMGQTNHLYFIPSSIQSRLNNFSIVYILRNIHCFNYHINSPIKIYIVPTKNNINSQKQSHRFYLKLTYFLYVFWISFYKLFILNKMSFVVNKVHYFRFISIYPTKECIKFNFFKEKNLHANVEKKNFKRRSNLTILINFCFLYNLFIIFSGKQLNRQRIY